jgi:predicted acyltransferase
MSMERDAAVDVFRGAVVVLFLFLNFLFSFTPESAIPHILLHNQGNVLLPGDFIAPFFAFIMGVSLALSYAKRKERGQESAAVFRTYIKRFVLLILIGLFLDSLFVLSGLRLVWGVLQSLGVAGLVAVCVLPLSERNKVLAALLLLSVYGILLTQNHAFFDSVANSRNGGPLGALSYGAITIFGLVAGRILLEGKGFYRNAAVGGLALVAISLPISIWMPYNKLLVTPSYSLITSGAAFVVLAAFKYMEEKHGFRSEILSLLGRSSLLAWVLQYPLAYYPLTFAGYGTLGFPEGFSLAVVLTLVSYLIVRYADKKGIRFGL